MPSGAHTHTHTHTHTYMHTSAQSVILRNQARAGLHMPGLEMDSKTTKLTITECSKTMFTFEIDCGTDQGVMFNQVKTINLSWFLAFIRDVTYLHHQEQKHWMRYL